MTGERKRRYNTKTKTNNNNKVRRRIVRSNNSTKAKSNPQINGTEQLVNQQQKKKLIRKERNRINARRFRERKKVYVETLEQETKTLKTENFSLTDKLNKVQQENLLLRKQIEQLKRDTENEKGSEEQKKTSNTIINQIESNKEPVKENNQVNNDNDNLVSDLSSPVDNEFYDPFPSSFQKDEAFDFPFSENSQNSNQQNQFSDWANELESSSVSKSEINDPDLFGLQFFL
ncbi:transcriptional activator hac1 [Anaeramoeba flamelloides]|uniref:Transcriptional activator hac1 n=1 Tax=Anaeramoeba flamelloides TaxID=1746091 RepID=A0ABQ8YDL7_9EUKA|nr:transcriptional activator hac1 [Anaeramoeba flamelloides]